MFLPPPLASLPPCMVDQPPAPSTRAGMQGTMPAHKLFLQGSCFLLETQPCHAWHHHHQQQRGPTAQHSTAHSLTLCIRVVKHTAPHDVCHISVPALLVALRIPRRQVRAHQHKGRVMHAQPHRNSTFVAQVTTPPRCCRSGLYTPHAARDPLARPDRQIDPHQLLAGHLRMVCDTAVGVLSCAAATKNTVTVTTGAAL